jgi:uncharacterized protein (DUF2336 family)
MCPADSSHSTFGGSTASALHYAQLDVGMRAAMAQKLGERYGAGATSDVDLKVANDLIAEMIKDAAIQVRQALVETLQRNPHAPRAAIKALAVDDDAVALPVLRVSEILTPDDLVEILNTAGTMSRMTAVAHRKALPSSVSDVLCERGDANVVSALFSNTGAQISAKGYDVAIDRVGKAEAVQLALVRRPSVPLSALDRISVMLSEHVRAQLVANHGLSVDAAMSLVLPTQQRLTVGLATGMTDKEVAQLTKELYQNGRLTDPLVIRALCMANLQFFEQAIAVRALISVPKVREILSGQNPTQIGQLLKSASVSEKWTAFVIQAIGVLNLSSLDTEQLDVAPYKSKIVERILTICADHDADFAQEDLDYIFSQSPALSGARAS